MGHGIQNCFLFPLELLIHYKLLILDMAMDPRDPFYDFVENHHQLIVSRDPEMLPLKLTFFELLLK